MEYSGLIYGINGHCKPCFHYRSFKYCICCYERLHSTKRAGLKPVFKPENLEINLFGIESWGHEDKISKNINNLNQHFFSPSFRVMRERSVFKRTTFQI